MQRRASKKVSSDDGDGTPAKDGGHFLRPQGLVLMPVLRLYASIPTRRRLHGSASTAPPPIKSLPHPKMVVVEKTGGFMPMMGGSFKKDAAVSTVWRKTSQMAWGCPFMVHPSTTQNGRLCIDNGTQKSDLSVWGEGDYAMSQSMKEQKEPDEMPSWYLNILIILASFQHALASEDEFRLIKDLRENYDPVERPVRNHTDAVNVDLRVILQQIVDVDEKNQILQLVLWTQFKWHDYKMVWNPAEYGNLTEIRLPPGALWRPDVLLFTSADENFDARFPVNFVVQHTGEVLCAPPSIVKSSCRIDITWFPFDDQICGLTYGSWTYTGRELDLFIDDSGLNETYKMDLKYYVPNGEWELIGAPAIRNKNEFEGGLYVELIFYVKLRRKSIYYGMNWIIPSILISLSNVLGFTLSPECGEKITLQITNLLSVTVFLGMVADITPPTSESVPVIAAFFSLSMIILGISIFVTIIIVNIFYRSPKTHKMGETTRVVFLEWLPWLLMMNRPGTKFKKLDELFPLSSDIVLPKPSTSKPQIRRSDASAVRMVRGESNSSLERTKNYKRERDLLIHEAAHGGAVVVNMLRKQQSPNDCNCDRPASPSSSTSSSADTDQLFLYDTLRELNNYLRMRRRIIVEEEEEEDLQADWRYIAMVIDRLCLYIFTLLTVFSLVLIVVAKRQDMPGY
uniref:Neur_chan_LBD domain-containing protein n=1 Tax=Panagrellus redivivus TaxID=6233 RepID=A0A7E4V0M4_PANRE